MSAEWWSVILQAITVFAVAFAAFQLMFHSRQMHRDLEMAYVERYWSLMDERSVKFVWSQQASELGKQAMGYANVAVWKTFLARRTC